ncbi:MAG TPA: amidohydrolase family protein, partial [Synergistales bacterium]|nr:amidohydrolase family protein [Synergistales bacterium]
MEKKYDIVIYNGMLLDGAGNPYVRKDLAISSEKIEKIGMISPEEGRLSIDAAGKVVCPGFIDLHNHCDQGILPFPHAESSLLQGVTTSVVGNCGLSMAPVNLSRLDLLVKYNLPFLHPGYDYEWDWTTLREYYDKVQSKGMGQNLAPLVGQGTLRVAVKGFNSSPASANEMEEMKKLLEQAMEEGAFGLSTGLIYPPGSFTETTELIELAGVLKNYGGIYVSHVRNESGQLIESVDEAIA